MRRFSTLIAAALIAAVVVSVTRRRLSAGEPAQRPLAEPTPADLAPADQAPRDRTPALPGLDLAAVVAEPESVTRFLSSPRRFSNKQSNSYDSVRNGADRWPYAHEFRGSGQ